MAFTTVGDLVKELQKYDQGTPLIGFYFDGAIRSSNVVSVIGAYPDEEGRCDNVQVCFWGEKDALHCGRVEPTGEKWEHTVISELGW